MLFQLLTVAAGLFCCFTKVDFKLSGALTLLTVAVDILLQFTITFVCFNLGGQTQLKLMGFTMTNHGSGQVFLFHLEGNVATHDVSQEVELDQI